MGAILIGLLLLVGFFFLSRWIVRKMFEFREDIYEAEEPIGFWEKLLYRIVRFIFVTADRFVAWLGRKSSKLACPVIDTPKTNFLNAGLGALVGLFSFLATKFEGPSVWMILTFILFPLPLFEWLVSWENEGEEKRLRYGLTWGGYLVYAYLYWIAILLLLIIVLLLIGWAIASNAETTSVGGGDSSSKNIEPSSPGSSGSAYSGGDNRQVSTVKDNHPSDSSVLNESHGWSYGTARFKGDMPHKSLDHGGVMIYYNGSLKQTGISGRTEIWECTGDVCVIFPKNYSGYNLEFRTNGSLQIQYL